MKWKRTTRSKQHESLSYPTCIRGFLSGVSGLWFGVLGLGFRVKGLALGSRVWGLGFRPLMWIAGEDLRGHSRKEA